MIRRRKISRGYRAPGSSLAGPAPATLALSTIDFDAAGMRGADEVQVESTPGRIVITPAGPATPEAADGRRVDGAPDLLELIRELLTCMELAEIVHPFARKGDWVDDYAQTVYDRANKLTGRA